MHNLCWKVCRAALVVSLLAIPAHAARFVFVQPIQVCDDLGSNCANPTQDVMEPVGDKIWSQANIDLVFLPFARLDETDFLVIGDGTEAGLNNELSILFSVGPGAHPDYTVISMWFVDQLAFDAGTVLGVAGSLGGNRVAISDEIFNASNRIDTIAHEIGHALGLGHPPSGAFPTTSDWQHNLMTAGTSRIRPNNINEVVSLLNPGGTDRLVQPQIDIVSASYLVTADGATPEPGTWTLLGGGLLACLIRRRIR